MRIMIDTTVLISAFVLSSAYLSRMIDDISFTLLQYKV
jgi:predicted nucleic acid-binding protein